MWSAKYCITWLKGSYEEDSTSTIGLADLLTQNSNDGGTLTAGVIGRYVQFLFKHVTISRVWSKELKRKIRIYTGLKKKIQFPLKDEPRTISDIHQWVPSPYFVCKNDSDEVQCAMFGELVNDSKLVRKISFNISGEWELYIGETEIALHDLNIENTYNCTRQSVLDVCSIVCSLNICKGKPKEDFDIECASDNVIIYEFYGEEKLKVGRHRSCKRIISPIAITDTCITCQMTLRHDTNNISPESETSLCESSREDIQAVLEEVLPDAPKEMIDLLVNQKQNLSRDPKGRRWDKRTISLCLSLWCRSQKSYQQLRDSKMLLLPSGRLLSYYKTVVDQQPGYLDVCEEVNKYISDGDVPNGVCIDEMSVQDDLCLTKSKGEDRHVGFVEAGVVGKSISLRQGQSLAANKKQTKALINMAKNETVVENGVKLEFPTGLRRSEQVKFYNPKLAILREAVLATLKIEADSVEKPLVCLDAFAGSGLTGIQWKLHLGNKVHVVLSEETHVKANCAQNEMDHTYWALDPAHSTGQWPAVKQNEKEVHVCPYKASVILHEEAFNFIFLQRLFNHIAQYTDSVFSNLRHNGVACFMTPNMASPCFRSPKIIQRLYQSHTQKTEYVNELAVRTFIADLAKAAAKYQRGITVLYTLGTEDHFLVAVKVTRNNQSALSCVENCRPILHCLMCEERVVYPQTNSPVENPYSYLPCDCKQTHPGKTAVILGPLWVGEIFSVSFIEQLLASIKDKTSETCIKLRTLLDSVLEEAICRGESQMSNTIDNNSDATTDTNHSCGIEDQCHEPVKKKQKIENEDKCEHKIQESVESTTKNTNAKTVRLEQNPTNMPLFYYDIQTKKYKVIPKLDKLVTMLRAAGYRASRTHFERHAVRTSANLKQLNEVVQKVANK